MKFITKIRVCRLLLLLLLALGRPAVAQIPSAGIDEFVAPADPRWIDITRSDVDAAFKFIVENHPAAAREVGDTRFTARLADAHSRALDRARSAISYDAYVAVLAGLATDLGDKHLWSRPTYVRNLVRWPGLIVSLQGSSWVVVDADKDPTRRSLIGARILSCDGESVDTLAARNLGGFRAAWGVPAQRFQKAPWLLVDESNPYFRRPGTCRFNQAGADRSVSLEWMRVKREELLLRLAKAGGAGASGFSVEPLGRGYWISLQSLDGRAEDIVKQVQTLQENLRAADFVVLDLRGNGGGSSSFGREIAKSLLGLPFVENRLGPDQGPLCGNPDGSWRASPGNYANLKYMLQSRAASLPREAVVMLTAESERMRLAMQQNKALTGPVRCPIVADHPRKQAAPLMRGRLVLITDNLCFSSCLSVTDDFRHLGALHLGQTTDQATHYTEVREAYLPSGYSLFSTLQALDPTGDYQVGPFVPKVEFTGNIAETADLKAWVQQLLASEQSSSARGENSVLATPQQKRSSPH